jgi:hypothetical protein
VHKEIAIIFTRTAMMYTFYITGEPCVRILNASLAKLPAENKASQLDLLIHRVKALGECLRDELTSLTRSLCHLSPLPWVGRIAFAEKVHRRE